MNDWIIYLDQSRKWWDATEDDNLGAIGSNWTPCGAEEAQRFIHDMETLPDWERRHWNAPRF